MSQVREELMKATKIVKREGESQDDMLGRLHKAVLHISDEAWNGLSEPAQDWTNAVTDLITEKKSPPPYPAFKDEEKKAPVARKTGETADATSTPAATAFEPKVGANVTMTDKRGRIVHGVIVEIDEDIVVLNKDGEVGQRENDVEVLRKGSTIVPSNTKEASELETTASAATAAVADDDLFPKPPDVGDTVVATTSRDKVITGKVDAIDETEISIIDEHGEIHDLVIRKLKDCQIKTRAHKEPVHEPRPETAAAKAAVAATEQANATEATQAKREADVANAAPLMPIAHGVPGTPPTPAVAPNGRGKGKDGISVGNRVRDIMIEDPTLSIEAVQAKLKAEGYTAADATVKMTRTDALYIIEKMKHKNT